MTKPFRPADDEGLLSRWARLKTRTQSGSSQTTAAPGVTDNPADTDEELDPFALRQLFQQQEFNRRDGMNEYDEGYTGFTSLGALVTREMQRALVRAEQMEDAEIDTVSAVSPDDEKLA